MKYNILKNAHIMQLQDNKYVTQKMIAEALIYNNTLLVSGAGSGKTTAIYNYTMQNLKKVVLAVPTTLLAQNLDSKYGKEDNVACFYSESKHTFKNQNLIILTYDKFKQYSEELKDYLLVIDEAHESINFKSINDEKRELLDFMHYSSNKKLYITASPYNLCKDKFDHIILGKQDLGGKDFTIYKSNTRGCLNNAKSYILTNPGKKLVFINSRTYAENFRAALEEENFSVLTIFSKNQKDEEVIEWLNTCEDVNNYDVVIVSKVMNIGYDLNYVFDEILYINPNNVNIDINALIQISARDRQTKKVTAFYNVNHKGNYMQNINSYYKNSKKNKMSDKISECDYHIFNDAYFNNYLDEHFAVSSRNYAMEGADYDEINEEFNKLYFNFTIEHIDYDSCAHDEVMRQSLVNGLKSLNVTAVELMKAFNRGEAVKYYDGLTDSNKKKTTALLLNLKKANIHPNSLDGLNTEDLIRINTFKNYNLSDSPIMIKILDALSGQEFSTSADVSLFCDILNENDARLDGKAWTKKNFKKGMERFGIFFKSKKLTKAQHELKGFEFDKNSKKEALFNVTIQLTDLIKISNEIYKQEEEELINLLFDNCTTSSIMEAVGIKVEVIEEVEESDEIKALKKEIKTLSNELSSVDKGKLEIAERNKLAEKSVKLQKMRSELRRLSNKKLLK